MFTRKWTGCLIVSKQASQVRGARDLLMRLVLRQNILKKLIVFEKFMEVIFMVFKEYSEKNKKNIHNMNKEQVVRSEKELKQVWSHIKNQNVSEDGALDENVLNAVAGGVGDIEVKTDVTTEVKNIKNETVNDITIKDSHRNESIVEKSIEANGDIFADGGIFF